ncbi:MAG: AgmX/PglI C-terminal domain-containing protein [Pseudomonadales bacterium]|nr:AgmX/PglI C-terminal domain-containing protein [Pseudomonadales bacterium]
MSQIKRPAQAGKAKVAPPKKASVRKTAKAHTHDFALPWENATNDRIIFKKWLSGSLAFVLAVGLVMPWLVLPEIERAELEELPPQLARIVLEKPEPKIPPPPKKLEEPKPKEPEKEKEKKEEPKPKEELVAKAEPKVANAKEKAAVSGLLQFKDAFADMREAVDVSALQDTAAIQRGAGSAATIDRSILTSKHSTRSAGVNVAALSRETGGVALAGRETTKVDAPENVAGTGGVRKPREVDSRDRSIEEIRRVFDSNKGSIFAIYNRTLRSNPALQGEVVLELVIDPNGQVVECKVVASEIDDQMMIDKIVNRVRLFNFGTREVRRTKIRYPVHFLPT